MTASCPPIAGRKTAHACPGDAPSGVQSIALFATRPPPTLRVGRHATTRSRAASPDVAGPPAANRRFPLYRE
ncbi:conserved hypothetical protein [Xanthomonas citri pv. fuscans]|nr:conserved hypothetical protein [Xanthomonas citri pv. fuscans]SON99948.1 conserved hypothetical protein [Xanthomonas citri pv. fuscans]SOO03339.1 conserved hypothetical protein [Xanthomonas citri pv. fuscans]SOO10522.1 conserved hypothetical protein [Xanthomonas citri pv. fuscans]SOO15134.1 conserved hypothetical protein [Xanthomonas citri pv. fuscans]